MRSTAHLVVCNTCFESNSVEPIAVSPFDGTGATIVQTDVAHEVTRQVFDRSEDAAGDDVALDFGEPNLDLIEPGGAGAGNVRRAATRRSSQLQLVKDAAAGF
jgi:hypothetical protein